MIIIIRIHFAYVKDMICYYMTVEYNGTVLTKFLEKSLFPCSAKVVSFGLFDSSLPILDFLNSDIV